jgi:hypothetical protein
VWSSNTPRAGVAAPRRHLPARNADRPILGQVAEIRHIHQLLVWQEVDTSVSLAIVAVLYCAEIERLARSLLYR